MGDRRYWSKLGDIVLEQAELVPRFGTDEHDRIYAMSLRGDLLRLAPR
jgi:hypothetical protein